VGLDWPALTHRRWFPLRTGWPESSQHAGSSDHSLAAEAQGAPTLRRQRKLSSRLVVACVPEEWQDPGTDK